MSSEKHETPKKSRFSLLKSPFDAIKNISQKKHDDDERENIAKWLRLHLTDQVGSRTFAKLLDYFGDIDSIIHASPYQLSQVQGISLKKGTKIAAGRDDIDVDEELALADKLGVEIITIESEAYPPHLKAINDPPHVLYVKGSLTRSDKIAIAVVGSRGCSQYGQEQAAHLSHLLAAAGFTIISGLARGIDSAAHRGAIAAKGRTIAVQGCGLANIYPPENKELATLITRHGAVVSELPLRAEPIARNFPKRNRIIAGMSLATLVVEARMRSGAQITARLAMEYNRDVMAIPGRIDAPGSALPHQLIKDGAVLVESIQDIIDNIGKVGEILKDHTAETSKNAEEQVEPTLFDIKQLNLTEPEAKIVDFLDRESVHIDQIITGTQLPAGPINAAVTSLQLKGVIKQLPGNYYQKRQ
ncbi:MAG: DNA-processing protein DprA [Phycisphaerae bacterium]|nr:DNA-processing protein DprA [Phycisphaerae bacterium]